MCSLLYYSGYSSYAQLRDIYLKTQIALLTGTRIVVAVSWFCRTKSAEMHQPMCVRDFEKEFQRLDGGEMRTYGWKLSADNDLSFEHMGHGKEMRLEGMINRYDLNSQINPGCRRQGYIVMLMHGSWLQERNCRNVDYKDKNNYDVEKKTHDQRGTGKQKPC